MASCSSTNRGKRVEPARADAPPSERCPPRAALVPRSSPGASSSERDRRAKPPGHGGRLRTCTARTLPPAPGNFVSPSPEHATAGTSPDPLGPSRDLPRHGMLGDLADPLPRTCVVGHSRGGVSYSPVESAPAQDVRHLLTVPVLPTLPDSSGPAGLQQVPAFRSAPRPHAKSSTPVFCGPCYHFGERPSLRPQPLRGHPLHRRPGEEGAGDRTEARGECTHISLLQKLELS